MTTTTINEQLQAISQKLGQAQSALDNAKAVTIPDSSDISKGSVTWLPFAAIAAIAAGFGLFAGAALSGGLF